MTSAEAGLGYRVVYVSSQDDRFGEDVESVNSALRNGDGWVSSKYCHFPQEIILKLHQTTNIKTIQLLCHHAFIPTKVDVFVGHSQDNASWSKATYEKLGTVTFQDTSISDSKTRELKTVRLDSNGSLVKLVVYDNYKSEQNAFSQVALMNVTIFGHTNESKSVEISDSDDKNKPVSRIVTSTTAPTAKNAEELKIMQGMSYTQEIRAIGQLLDVKKKAAIRDEDFEAAKCLKMALEKLRLAGEDIDKLNNEKRSAIEEEDYDKAEQYKKEIGAIRERTYNEIGLANLLDDKEKQELGLESRKQGSRPPSNAPRLKRSESAPSNKRSNASPKSNPYLDRDNMVLPAIRHQQQRLQQSKPPTRQCRNEQDSKLPRINNSSSGIRVEEYPVETGPGTEAGNESESDEHAIYRLHPKDVAQLQLAMNTFGAKLVKNCTSKQWQERQKGLEDLGKYLDQHNYQDRDDAYNILAPTLQLLQRALKDKIFNVYKAATSVLRFILVTFLPRFKISKAGGTLIAERTYYILISRAGDTVSDPRFRPTSIEFAENAVSKADIQIAKAFAICFLRPFQASGHQKIDQAHAEIAERIITANVAPNAQLDITEENICSFAVSCLQHTDAAVRQTGARVLSYIYKMGDKEKVRRHLPRNNETTKKKWPLYKTIFDEFDRIDGKMGPNFVAPLDGSRQSIPRESTDVEKLKRENEELKRQLTETRITGTSATTPLSTRSVKTSYGVSNRDGYGENDSESMCVFCGEVSSTFDEETLDMHYLKYCPMLTKCQLCKKVVEISALKEHYFYECALKHLFRQCPRCKEPILEQEFSRHQIQQRCQLAKSGVAVERCLLCHKDVTPNNDIGWRRHLIGAMACSGNPRKTHGAGSGKAGYKGQRRNSTGAIDGKRIR